MSYLSLLYLLWKYSYILKYGYLIRLTYRVVTTPPKTVEDWVLV